MATSHETEVLRIESCVRGFHVYKETWSPNIGELLVYTRESGNVIDRYAVAVKKSDGTVVGHSPKRRSLCHSILVVLK